MTEAEYELFELVQTLASDFTLDLIKILEYIPSVGTSRNAEEAIDAINDAISQ